MRLTVLAENEALPGLKQAHGLAYLLEDGKRWLWDTGPSDLIIQNASRLGISLEQLDGIILSHGHWDHGNGLLYFDNLPLITHPQAFMKRYRKSDHRSIGLPLTEKKAREQFDLILTKEPYALSDKLIYLGEIPRENDFEAKKTPFLGPAEQEDFVPDDSALVYTTRHGLVIIAGCAHAGICNTLEYARKVTGDSRILTVIGGFHLKEADEVTLNTISYFREQNIQNIYPSHCVSPRVIQLFVDELQAGRVRAGDVFTF
jgi:7,8-dihydropterin-6-yl-methyl-4-(beta-D-ribofuranosyl)aminobenzene 5'-phosphate synthase